MMLTLALHDMPSFPALYGPSDTACATARPFQVSMLSQLLWDPDSKRDPSLCASQIAKVRQLIDTPLAYKMYAESC